MNFQQLSYVVAVADLGHFGLAADKCCVTQSTLSTMIGKLENQLDIRIFNRKTKPARVTREGEVLIVQFRKILKEMDQLGELVDELKGEMAGEIHLGVIPTVAPYLLPRFLHGFTKQFPKMHFSVSELTTESIVNRLRKRELDLGIVAIPLQAPYLETFPLYDEEFVLYDCRPGSQSQEVDLHQLNFEEFWLMEEGHCLSNQVIKICDFTDQCKTDVNFDFKAGSIDSLIRFVRQSEGLTLLPYLATTDFSAADQARISRFKKSVPVRTIGLIAHEDFVKKQLIKLLIDKIKERISPMLSKTGKGAEVIAPF